MGMSLRKSSTPFPPPWLGTILQKGELKAAERNNKQFCMHYLFKKIFQRLAVFNLPYSRFLCFYSLTGLWLLHLALE